MAKKEAVKVEFLNPFKPGVNYEQFLGSVPSGLSVKEYCEGNLTKEEIEWLEADLEHYKQNKKE